MLGSIHIGMSSLQGHAEGLRVIANNTANLNTPGFKGSSLQFADVFFAAGPDGSGLMRVGHGLATGGTELNFAQGELRQSGNALDLAIDGQGLFTLRDAQGRLHYTRAGQFAFDKDQVLVNRADGSKVMAMGADGELAEISLAGRGTLPGQATSKLVFTGYLSGSATQEHVMQGVKVLDALGNEHALTLRFAPVAGTPGSFKVSLRDGDTEVGSAEIAFADGKPRPGMARPRIDYQPPGFASQAIELDFESNVLLVDAGATASLQVASRNGHGPGTLGEVSVDGQGRLVMSYANADKVTGPQLALGRFDTLEAVQQRGDNQFDAVGGIAWHMGVAEAQGFGSVKAGMVELSNVDLSREFSDLVIMQRGYQAASQVIATASEMLQELFSMRGQR